MLQPEERELAAAANRFSIRGTVQWVLAALTALHLAAAVAGPLTAKFAPELTDGLAGLVAGRSPEALAVMMAAELPGGAAAIDADEAGSPSRPVIRSMLAEWRVSLAWLSTRGADETAGLPPPTAGPDPAGPQPSPLEPSPTSQPDASPQPTAEPTQQPSVVPTHTGGGDKPASGQTTGGRRVVLVYHTHPQESWKPETKQADDAKRNITLVGKRLAERLEDLGVGAVHSNVDYKSTVSGYNWNYSYTYSLQTVREAMAAHEDLKFFFDLHRDSAGRALTTLAGADGSGDYAKIMFVVGRGNKHWEQNEAFATRLGELLNDKVPGISRGIRDKDKTEGHGEYNQSLSPNSIVIEIGGVDNTLEECERTADVLAKAIAELYWQADQVNAVAELAMR